MKKGTEEFYQVYKETTINICKNLIAEEALNSLFPRENKMSDAIEVRFDLSPNIKQRYDQSIIYLQKGIKVPPTHNFNWENASQNINSLEEAINKIVNYRNLPETIRIIKSADNSAYAIFTR